MRTATLCTVAAAALLLLLALAEAAGPQEALYAKYENLDVDRMLRNQRLVAATIKCLMDEAPCTPEARDLKKVLPDALKSDCSKCSAKQKENVRKVFEFMMKERSADWQRLSRKYDPDGEHKKRLEAKLKEAQQQQQQKPAEAATAAA
ncbi:ejaculatory bulb-specific protein 3-like [Schistocerca piceifrons]|uniref:ejaculatory bulb-specific protein 3-like n=1 Tax=Schistocerca piceifrons TaxID=274613 RepID=UPI001F5ED8C8|nr:ejaculatory bulb-specific protein 3-like [Schistocerca piceifrons]XP_049963542.1 ejaculatory bulb-specific protein 3-like [Schistocerca serialis cubense]